jgi:tetratricopeptide (TPR) repeat protein
MVIAAPAQAQRGEPPSEPPGEENGNTLDDEARSLFEAGRTAYAGGRYRAAYDYFAQAYRLSQRLGLLYNMAQAADRARLDAEALEAYRTFLEARPDTAERVMIEQRIHDLSSSAPRTPEPAEPERDEPAPTPAGGAGPAPWIVVGVGAAVVIGGAILLTVGLLDRSSVEGAPRDTVWADVAGAYDRAPALMVTGDVMIGVGLAAVATGIVWAIMAPSPAASDSVSFGVGPGGFAVRGRFDVAQ